MFITKPRREKLSDDPNNLNWKNGENFGKKILNKFGWNDGEGLGKIFFFFFNLFLDLFLNHPQGKDRNGMTSHIQIRNKRNNVGIGSGNDDINWMKTNFDFLQVLNKLNQNFTTQNNQQEETKSHSSTTKFHRYNKVIKSKNVSQYSSNDLSAILGSTVAPELKYTPSSTPTYFGFVKSSKNLSSMDLIHPLQKTEEQNSVNQDLPIEPTEENHIKDEEKKMIEEERKKRKREKKEKKERKEKRKRKKKKKRKK